MYCRFTMDIYTTHTYNVIVRANTTSLPAGFSGSFQCKASNAAGNCITSDSGLMTSFVKCSKL